MVCPAAMAHLPVKPLAPVRGSRRKIVTAEHDWYINRTRPQSSLLDAGKGMREA